jgi:hypothetical protein
MIRYRCIPLRTMIVNCARVALAVGILLVSSLAFADVKPADTRMPVFRIYAAVSSPNQQRLVRGPQITFDSKRPLLVVSSARDVRPTRDGNGVVFMLTDKDAKAFAAASRKYNNGLLIVEGQGTVLSVMHITEPLSNGVLEFKDSEDASVVRYLRNRFNLGGGR